jgi:hypothetical protein
MGHDMSKGVNEKYTLDHNNKLKSRTFINCKSGDCVRCYGAYFNEQKEKMKKYLFERGY